MESYHEKLKKKREAKRDEKKKRLKELFDAEYDRKEDGSNAFYDDWKAEMEQQAQVGRDIHD